MARLTDITLDNQFHPAEGPHLFQQRANYVAGCYLLFLGRYRPPHTTRLCVTVVPAEQPPSPLMAGSVACVDQPAHAPTYDALPDPAKLCYLLDLLHAAVGHLCQAFAWDEVKLDNAYRQLRRELEDEGGPAE